MRESDAVARLRSQLSDKELDLIEIQQSYERLMRMTEETRDLLKQTHEEKDEYRKHEAIAEQLKIRNDTLQLKIDELSEKLKREEASLERKSRALDAANVAIDECRRKIRDERSSKEDVKAESKRLAEREQACKKVLNEALRRASGMLKNNYNEMSLMTTEDETSVEVAQRVVDAIRDIAVHRRMMGIGNREGDNRGNNARNNDNKNYSRRRQRYKRRGISSTSTSGSSSETGDDDNDDDDGDSEELELEAEEMEALEEALEAARRWKNQSEESERRRAREVAIAREQASDLRKTIEKLRREANESKEYTDELEKIVERIAKNVSRTDFVER